MLQQLDMIGPGPGLIPGPVFVCFELAGEPRAKGTHRSRIFWPKGAKSMTGEEVMAQAYIMNYPDPQTKAFSDAVAWLAKGAMRGRAPTEREVAVLVHAFRMVPKSWPRREAEAALAGRIRPTSKPDDDNFLKMRDALNGIVWKDDAQSVDSRVLKFYSERPAWRIEVREMILPDAVASASPSI